MATRKKTTTKKPAVKKTTKTVAKRTAAKKAPETKFWNVKFTANTLYWIIIGIAVVSTALISYDTNQRINDVYDDVDAINAQDY